MNKHVDDRDRSKRRHRSRAGSGPSTSPSRAAARTAPSPGACSTACSRRRRIAFEGISATSAGAMNAAVLAYGLTDGGRDGAKTALRDFWRRVCHAALFSPLQPSLFDRLTHNHGARELAGLPHLRHPDRGCCRPTSSIR